MKKKTHGGSRPNAGRKKGSGSGRKVVSKTIAMKHEAWATLDAIRGDQSRGGYIEKNLKGL